MVVLTPGRVRSKQEVLTSAKNIASYGEERLNQIKAERMAQRRKLGMTGNEQEDLEDFFRNVNRDSYEVAKSMVQLVLEEVMFGVGQKVEAFNKMLEQQDELEHKKERVLNDMKEIKHRSAMAQIRDDMIERVVAEIALETVKENLYLSKKIDEKMLEILVRALKLERGSSTSQKDLQVLAQNLEDEKLVAAREAIMNLFEENPTKASEVVPSADTEKV